METGKGRYIRPSCHSKSIWREAMLDILIPKRLLVCGGHIWKKKKKINCRVSFKEKLISGNNFFKEIFKFNFVKFFGSVFWFLEFQFYF